MHGSTKQFYIFLQLNFNNMIKKAKLIFTMVLAVGLASIYLEGCKKDDSPSALTIVSITSTGTNLTTGSSQTVDLNGATSPTDVPTDGVLTLTFSKSVNAATATSTSITISDGTANAPLTLATTGAAVVITLTNELVRGTLYTISVTSALMATDGGKLTAASRTFTTAGKKPPVVPQSSKLVVYLPFEGTVVDILGHTVLNSSVGFTTDRFGNFNGSADFNGTTNYVGIQYGTDMSNANTTVSYWIKLPASQAYKDHIGTTAVGDIKQYVTFAIGGNNGTYHEWNRFTCCGLTYDLDVIKYFTNHKNSGTASTLAGSIIEMKNEGNPGGDKIVEVNNVGWLEGNTGKWMHIVTSWNTSTRTKSFYINGVPSTVYKLTPSPEYALDDAVIDVAGIDLDPTNSRNLYLGSGVPYWATVITGGITPFRSGIPFAFEGQMDDFRMYNVALTDAEVTSLYEAEKP
jgi:hypothetical protein